MKFYGNMSIQHVEHLPKVVISIAIATAIGISVYNGAFIFCLVFMVIGIIYTDIIKMIKTLIIYLA